MRHSWYAWLVVLVLLIPGRASAEEGDAAAAFMAQIRQMQETVKSLKDATYTFHQKEWASGKQQPAHTMEVKYRRPGDVYMKFVGDKHSGRELIFRPDWNDGKMRVKPGAWLPTVNLHPDGRLAMRGQRHSIRNVGFPFTVSEFGGDTDRIAANPGKYEVRVEDHGVSKVFGEDARCFTAELPKEQEPEFYARKVRICVHLRTKLPAHVQAWDFEDGAVRLIEDYGFERAKINVSLTDQDFDPDNEAYNF